MKKVTLFSCYIEEYVDFVPFSGAFRGNASFGSLDPPLKVVVSPSLVITHLCICIPTIDVVRIFRDGCIRLVDPSFSAPGAPWSPKAAQLLLI